MVHIQVSGANVRQCSAERAVGFVHVSCVVNISASYKVLTALSTMHGGIAVFVDGKNLRIR